ncbi:hypothetical protein [Alishewanella tabrizica]|uniref:Photosystem II reaction center protein Z n=1 Tax=Alishewanella tabrizica TaxID=671278 RepID=A0ABQ2WG37_9ALTE|nr:hypothetical protein [Alishewanella tabrizica]GGW51419.1 hypothetical protein GCM10008111_04230 [Alishewanella tabrizica]
MTNLLAIMGPALLFTAQLLLLLSALICSVLIIFPSSSDDPEKRFEQRLEYVIFTIGTSVLWLLVAFAPR